MPGVRCQGLGARGKVSDVRYYVLGIRQVFRFYRHLTSDIQTRSELHLPISPMVSDFEQTLALEKLYF